MHGDTHSLEPSHHPWKIPEYMQPFLFSSLCRPLASLCLTGLESKETLKLQWVCLLHISQLISTPHWMSIQTRQPLWQQRVIYSQSYIWEIIWDDIIKSSGNVTNGSWLVEIVAQCSGKHLGASLLISFPSSLPLMPSLVPTVGNCSLVQPL